MSSIRLVHSKLRIVNHSGRIRFQLRHWRKPTAAKLKLLVALRGLGLIEDDREARDTMVITRIGSGRVHAIASAIAGNL